MLLRLLIISAIVLAPSAPVVAYAWDSASTTALARQQPPPEGEQTAGEERGEAEHEESIWGPISRAFNSAVLFAVLYYFLRQPVAEYFGARGTQIRNDLVTASEMKQSAAEQIAALERKMADLPRELEALKVRGQEEIAAEEARIEQAAAADRERLLEQTRREIDLQLRLAHRELVEHASNLAVGLATERIKKSITPDDQSRIVDRYLEQVKR
jgi:F-type H+-transporting ATPase subunit b